MTNIYFIRNKDSIKIGRSKDIPQRLQNLQTANSSDLSILYVIENVEPSFEKHVQEICQRYNIKGEWFQLDVLNHLQKIPWFKENMKAQKTPQQ